MKPILKLSVAIFLIWLVSVISCKKDKDISSGQSASSNKPPVASAGPDTSFSVLTCSARNGSVELDGSASKDPDNDDIYYKWSQISGPSMAILSSAYSAKARVEGLAAGEYLFELTVTDKRGLSSKDQVKVNVRAAPVNQDLDHRLTGNYQFWNDLEDCYYYYPCSYYDLTEIQLGVTTPFTWFNARFQISEYADTTNLNDTHNTHLRIYSDDNYNNNVYASGTLSVNFRKLISQGGGSFTGTCQITDGSARVCDNNIYNGLSPLTVSGTLDTVTKKVELHIKGKIYF